MCLPVRCCGKLLVVTCCLDNRYCTLLVRIIIVNIIMIDTSREGLCQGGICVFSVSCFRTISYHTLCHSAIPPFRHSAIPPFCHSAIPPFHHSAIPPFCHSTPIRNNAMYVSQEVLRKAVMLPGGIRSNRYVPPLQAK